MNAARKTVGVVVVSTVGWWVGPAPASACSPCDDTPSGLFAGPSIPEGKSIGVRTFGELTTPPTVVATIGDSPTAVELRPEGQHFWGVFFPDATAGDVVTVVSRVGEEAAAEATVTVTIDPPLVDPGIVSVNVDEEAAFFAASCEDDSPAAGARIEIVPSDALRPYVPGLATEIRAEDGFLFGVPDACSPSGPFWVSRNVWVECADNDADERRTIHVALRFPGDDQALATEVIPLDLPCSEHDASEFEGGGDVGGDGDAGGDSSGGRGSEVLTGAGGEEGCSSVEGRKEALPVMLLLARFVVTRLRRRSRRSSTVG